MGSYMRCVRFVAVASLTAAIVAMTGCAGLQQTMARAGDAVRTHGGTLLGATAGAAAGALLCNKKNRLKCALAGGAVGASLGYLWDKRQARLKKIARQQQLPITTSKIKTFNASRQNGVAVAVNDGGMFASGSDQLTASAARKMRALATAYRDDPQRLLVVGHTDSTGGDALNLRLSEKRAYTVASLLSAQGIDKSRIFFQGVGESQPIADNDTASGRASNRRVEIIETDSNRSIAAYSLERESDPKFLAYSNKTRAEKQSSIQRPTSRVVSTPSAKPEPASPHETDRQVAQSDIGGAPPEGTNQTASESGLGQSASSASASSRPDVDFGGRPATQDITDIVSAAGETNDGGSGLSFIGTANAAEPSAISPCYMNSPRRTAAIRNLGSGQKLDPSVLSESDYWPGLNGNVWLTSVNGNLVAFKNLRVQAGSGTVAGQPQVLVYRHYHGQKQNPDYRMAAHTRSYMGKDGVIIRSYFDEDAPMQCMDVVMAKSSQRYAKAGVLYYDHGRQLYQNDVKLHRLGAGG